MPPIFFNAIFLLLSLNNNNVEVIYISIICNFFKGFYLVLKFYYKIYLFKSDKSLLWIYCTVLFIIIFKP